MGLRTCGRRFFIVVVAAMATCNAVVLDAAPDGGLLRIRNDSPHPWTLWMYAAHEKKWLAPRFLPRDQAVGIDLAAAGPFYLVLRDDGDREQHVGWQDLHAAVRELATPPDRVAELTLTTTLERRQMTETFAVQVPVQEQVVRTVVINGERKEVTEIVTKMVTEERQREVVVQVEVPTLRGTREGEPVDLADVGSVATEPPAPPAPPRVPRSAPAPR